MWSVGYTDVVQFALIPLGLFVALKEGLDWHSLRRIGPETSE